MTTLDIISEQNNAGGPAFPIENILESEVWTGMSLRDYYAGCALTGILARGSGFPPSNIQHIFDYAQAMVDEGIKRDFNK